MTDIQILTICIAVVFPVLAFVASIVAVLYSNRRQDDQNGTMNRAMDELSTNLKRSMNELSANLNRSMEEFRSNLNQRLDAFEKHSDGKMDNAFAHIELLLKLHEAEHHGH